jgi:hypothetical protein
MFKLRNLRDIGLVLAGVLAGASLFGVAEQASSAFRKGEAVQGAIIIEKDKAERSEGQLGNSDGWGQIIRSSSYYRPASVSSRLFRHHEDCGTAKLDVWLESGLLIYSLFNLDADASPAESTDVPGKTTMLIGRKDCQVRIVIERSDGRSGGK